MNYLSSFPDLKPIDELPRYYTCHSIAVGALQRLQQGINYRSGFAYCNSAGGLWRYTFFIFHHQCTAFNFFLFPSISFAITFLIIVIVVYLLAKMLEKSVDLLALGFLNKLAGAIFALLKIAFIVSVLLMFFNKIDSKTGILSEETKKHSLLYSPVSAFAPMIIPKINFEEIKKKVTPVNATSTNQQER